MPYIIYALYDDDVGTNIYMLRPNFVHMYTKG